MVLWHLESKFFFVFKGEDIVGEAKLAQYSVVKRVISIPFFHFRQNPTSYLKWFKGGDFLFKEIYKSNGGSASSIRMLVAS